MKSIKIQVILGSFRKESFSRRAAEAITERMPERFEPNILQLDTLPLFNQDYDDEGATPKEWASFREEIRSADGYLFVTPEYNRSYPPVLKNALDIASRPYGENAWAGKPGAVVSISPGKIGGFGANHHLRQILSFLDVYTMQQPEAYIGGADEIFDAEGRIADEGTEKFIQLIADSFAEWVEKFVK